MQSHRINALVAAWCSSTAATTSPMTDSRLGDRVRSLHDHFDAGVGLREPRAVARVQLDRVRSHAFGNKPLEVGRGGLVVFADNVPTRLRLPCRGTHGGA